MAVDYRAFLSVADFDAIVVDDEYPIDDYYQRLIVNNAKFQDVGEEYPHGYADIRLIPQLTKGQQLLILLGAFDGQVKNGGITQFFWNCPEYIFAVRDSIEYLGLSELLLNYEKALESLIGKKDQWLAFRQECYQDSEHPQWEPFRQTYALLNLDWFDKAYFDTRGYNERKEWVVQQRGLHYALLKRLAEYIKSHRSEFIAE